MNEKTKNMLENITKTIYNSDKFNNLAVGQLKSLDGLFNEIATFVWKEGWESAKNGEELPKVEEKPIIKKEKPKDLNT